MKKIIGGHTFDLQIDGYFTAYEYEIIGSHSVLFFGDLNNPECQKISAVLKVDFAKAHQWPDECGAIEGAANVSQKQLLSAPWDESHLYVEYPFE